MIIHLLIIGSMIAIVYAYLFLPKSEGFQITYSLVLQLPW